MYFVLLFSIHNYKVQKAWDAKEKEVADLKDEIETIRSSLVEEDWINEVEQTVRAGKQPELRNAVILKFLAIDALLFKTEEDVKDEEANALSLKLGDKTAPVGVEDSKGGRII